MQRTVTWPPVARFNADGSRDQSFGIDGVALAPMDPTPSPGNRDSSRREDRSRRQGGRRAMAHGMHVAHVAVARVDANGNGDRGLWRWRCRYEYIARVLRLPVRLLQPDGKDSRRRLQRGCACYLENGRPDSVLAALRLLRRPTPTRMSPMWLEHCRRTARSSLRADGTYRILAVARLTAAGILDSTFGDRECRHAGSASLEKPSAIAIQPDGRIVAAGTPGSLRVPPSPDLSLGQFKFGLVRYFGD